MDLPTLTTERLTLSVVEQDDAARIAELAGQREVARNTESIPHPYPVEEAKAWVEEVRESIAAGEAAVFGIRGRKDERLIGAVGLHPEPEHERAMLGYWLGKPYWNHGYATEAAREAVRWGFEALAIERIYAQSFVRNHASRRVLEKLGMQREGRLRRHFKKWDEKVDVEVYGILHSEHRAGTSRP